MTIQQRLRRVARWLRLSQHPLAHAATLIGIRVWRLIWSITGLLAWPLPAVRTLLRFAGRAPKRVLAIWDTGAQPYAIGDMLLFHAGALAIREQFGVKKIDLCVLCDEKRFKVDSPGTAEITPDNRFRYSLALIRLAQVNPHFGSLIYLDSREDFDAFITRNADRYHLWPPLGSFLGKEYLYHRIIELLAAHFRRTGKAPRLASTATAKQWARAFIKTHAGQDLPVVVQFRNNRLNEPRRNSNASAWLSFFERCNGRFPVKFFLISGSGEVHPQLRSLPNVILAKDHQSTIEEDLALIESSAFFLATNSGPSLMAFFSDVPYSILNWPAADELSPELLPGVLRAGDHLRFVWAAPNQRLIPSAENALLLQTEFELLLGGVDPGIWKKQNAGDGGEVSSRELRLW